KRADIIRPSALDVRQYGHDFIVAQNAGISRHVACIPLGCSTAGHHPILNNIHEYRVRVMPSVAGFIVRWCWQTPARTANSPVWLPFQIHAVAGGTMTHIQGPPKSDL